MHTWLSEVETVVDIIGQRFVESAIKRILFVEPQNGYSARFNYTVRVELLGPEYLAGAVQDVAKGRLVEVRAPDLMAQHWGYPAEISEVMYSYSLGNGYSTSVLKDSSAYERVCGRPRN